jgi:hypothetical protein
MQRWPKAVAVVALFLFVATGIAFFVGASLLFPNRVLDSLWTVNPPAEAHVSSNRPCCGRSAAYARLQTFAAANGLLLRKAWAWWFALILFVVNGIGDVVSFIVTGDWLRSASGVVISASLVAALCSRDVRRYIRL